MARKWGDKMVIGKRDKRVFWLGVVLSAAFDVFIATATASIVGAGFWGAVGIFLALQAIYFLVWLRATVFAWSCWFLFGKKYLMNRIAGFLSENRFPAPQLVIGSATDYLKEVVENDVIDVRTRLAAMADLSAFEFCGSRGLIQDALRLNIAYEGALNVSTSKSLPSITSHRESCSTWVEPFSGLAW